jgi:hypothetical protein
MQIKWGIGSFKHKWEKLMKIFDYNKPKYNHLFKVVVILINFLHKRCLDFTTEVIGNHIIDPTDYGWDRDY